MGGTCTLSEWLIKQWDHCSCASPSPTIARLLKPSRQILGAQLQLSGFKMEALAPYIPPALLPLAQTLHDQVPLVGVALVSLGAIYLGYIYILGIKEAAVPFNVPIPPEVRANWKGKAWEDVQGEEKKVLEGQLRGVR